LAVYANTSEAREAIAREARETKAAATIYNKLTYGR
jgi:heat shock protein HspQ